MESRKDIVFAMRAMRVSRVGSASRGSSGEGGRAGLSAEGIPEAMVQNKDICVAKGSMFRWIREAMIVAGSISEPWAFSRMVVMLWRPRRMGAIARV